MANATDTVFTADHLDTLRREFSKIERIDPCKPTYRKMIALLDSLSLEQLRQFAGADIKFASTLAATRVMRAEKKI